MEVLQELSMLVSRHKIKNIHLLDGETLRNSLEGKLYEAIQSKAVETEEEAMDYVYGDDASKERFKKLKYRLKDKLINTLFFIDKSPAIFARREKEIIRAHRNAVAVEILRLRGSMHAAVELAEKAVLKSTKYEVTEITTLMSNFLRMHYGVIAQDQRKFRKYEKIYQSAKEELDAELLVNSYFSQLFNELERTKASSTLELQTLCNEAYDKLKGIENKFDSVKFRRFLYEIFILKHQIDGNLNKVIEVCHKAISLLEEKPFEVVNPIFNYRIREFVCYIQLRDFERGERIAEENLNKMRSRPYNWFVLNYYFFLLCMHCQKYDKGGSLLHRVFEHPGFGKLNPNMREIFQLCQAASQFLSNRGIISERVQTKKDFKLAKFVNDVPIYSKAKRGFNISVLVLQTLFLLEKQSYSEIIDRIDSLNQYCYRYLRRDDTFRSNCFIKMLLQIPRADFNRKRTERYTQTYWDRLQSSSINVAQMGLEVEIIPYENLWPMVLEMLN